jgi:hypothetical protein
MAAELGEHQGRDSRRNPWRDAVDGEDRAGRPAAVEVVREISGPLVEDAWKLYEEAFRGLNEMAVQRHLMYRNEFDDVMSDERVEKYLAFAGTELVGLATFTNDLDAVPLLSPQYFERRWPDLYAERRIWYIPFMAVSGAGGGEVRAFFEFLRSMWLAVRAGNGIVALDTCALRATRLPYAIKAHLKRLGTGVWMEPMDVQTFWMYGFDGVDLPAEPPERAML